MNGVMTIVVKFVHCVVQYFHTINSVMVAQTAQKLTGWLGVKQKIAQRDIVPMHALIYGIMVWNILQQKKNLLQIIKIVIKNEWLVSDKSRKLSVILRNLK